ncbi:hypothetical protein QOZ80_9BG0717080 [Eleusine coracana subsp. coracana]|nr:hypothetical protein QOZ80_9BG0717080 [Eleusine coracana subsp. coracana]
MSESAAAGGILFSEYIDNNILTPLLSRLQVISDDQRFRGTDLLEDLDGNQGIRGLMRDLRSVFAGMAKKERSLVDLFDPIERLATTAIADSMIFQRTDDQPSSGSGTRRGRGGGGGSAGLVCYGEEHMEHLRRAVQGMDLRLRHCLLCLAAFPEGAVIKKRLLIHWWMGEGFVDSVAKGKERFQQLVGMRFASAVRRDHCDTAHACVVHPWIRRLLVSVAKASAFFYVDADPSQNNDFSWARRACLHDAGGGAGALPFKFNPEVLTIYNVDRKYIRLSDAWFSNKARLGTLQLGQWRASSAREQIADPKRSHIELIADEQLIIRGIGACKGLRYLSLRGISRIKAIPASIGKLGELLVLDLRACHNLEVLTKEVTKLHKLQYLDVSECYLLVEMPQGLGKLSQLQVLKGFVLASSSRQNACSLRELPALTGLRKLTIAIAKKLKRAEVQLSVLSKLTSLTSLKITWGTVSSQSQDAKEQQSSATRPPGFALPPHLSKLELCCFPCQEFGELVNPDGLVKNSAS